MCQLYFRTGQQRGGVSSKNLRGEGFCLFWWFRPGNRLFCLRGGFSHSLCREGRLSSRQFPSDARYSHLRRNYWTGIFRWNLYKRFSPIHGRRWPLCLPVSGCGYL